MKILKWQLKWNIMYLIDISAIDFVYDDSAKLQAGVKYPGISDFYQK